MTNQHIANTIKEVGLLLDTGLEDIMFEDLKINSKAYAIDEIFEFKRDLIESANKVRIVLLDQGIDANGLDAFVKDVQIPLIVIRKQEAGFEPLVLSKGDPSHASKAWMQRQHSS